MASAFRSSRLKQSGNRDELRPLLYQQPNQFSNSAQSFSTNQFQYYNPYSGGNFQFGQPSEPVNPSKVIHQDGDLGKDPHSQFCALTGCPPSNASSDSKYKVHPKSLYGRATRQKNSQDTTYNVTAALTNTLLLLQIVLGAALTGLGGSGVPPYVITVFGATNTVIAGLVTYLKSRGQPNRARMFRDDLERVVDEIENSEVMWLGIAKGVHGYDDIDTDDTVTVRSEVARLTRLFDKAVRTNTANNPDSYNAGASSSDSSGSANRGGGGGPFLTLPALNLPPVAGPSGGSEQAAASQQPAADADAAPATAPSKKKEDDSKAKEDAKKAESSTGDKKPEAPAAGSSKDVTKPPVDADKGKATTSAPAAATPAPAPAAARPATGDPDASPATMTQVRKKSATQVPKKEPGEPE